MEPGLLFVIYFKLIFHQITQKPPQNAMEMSGGPMTTAHTGIWLHLVIDYVIRLRDGFWGLYQNKSTEIILYT